MPDVKWVDANELFDDADIVRAWTTPTPVMTLDYLEAWLMANARTYSAARDVIFDDLLAQVQAMKDGRT